MDNSDADQQAVHTDVLEDLKKRLNDPGTDFTQRDPEGRSLLHQAVLAQADAQLVQDLSDRVDLAVRDVHGQTALDLLSADSAALRQVLEDKVKELVLAGREDGDKEAQRLVLAGWSVWPVTAEEAKEKSEEAVQILEKLLALKDKAEKVHKAVQEGQEEDLKQLLTEDSSQLATAADASGLRPLHKAVLFRQGAVLKFLVSTCTDSLDVTDHVGRSALHFAAALTGDPDLFQTLKDAGADDSLKDLAGRTAADYQQSPDLLPIADILKRLEGTTPSSADDGAGDKPDDTTATTTAAQDTAQQAVEEGSQETVQTEEPSADLQEPRNPTPPKAPARPLEVTPVTMYVAGPERDRAPPPTTVDGRYVSQHLGSALTQALAEIVEKRPWDPVEYLAHWLYKYRQNMDHLDKQRELLDDIRAEEEAANAEEVMKFKRREEELRIQEEERAQREEEEAARKKREQEELQRQAKEAVLAQKPQLPTVREEDAEDAMLRERDDKGQTELHLLAAQSGADLVAVMNLGYSLADRDLNNHTARDLAQQHGLTDNVDTIDNYVSNLLEQEKLDTLRQLVVDGYDKLDAVLSKVSTEGLPASVTDFVNAIPELQERVAAVLKAASGGEAGEVERMTEDRSLALAKDLHGRSPLHLALLAGHHDLAKGLVHTVPLSLKARDNFNRTPLHYAAALSEEMADFLKENGADSNAKDAKQQPPAFYKEHPDAILQLKDTLPQDSQTAGDVSLAVPQIRADHPDDKEQADDGQTKEDGAQEEGEGAGGEGEAVLATTSGGEDQDPGTQ